MSYYVTDFMSENLTYEYNTYTNKINSMMVVVEFISAILFVRV